jgi:hypothetical protein
MRTLGRALAVVAFAFCLTVTVIHFASQPHCPTEDSCTVDYHDGAWHIEPTR